MTPHVLLIGTIGEGVFRSLDHGESFCRALDGAFVECHVRALVSHPEKPRLLYLGSEYGLLRSADGADSWELVESPLTGQQIWSLLLPAGKPGVILAGTCPSRLFRSEDAGHSWQETTPAIQQDCPRIMYTRVTSLAADPSNPDRVWAGVEIDSVWRSLDGGRTWQKGSEGLSSQDVHSLAVIPGRRILAATNNDLNISDNGGESWRLLDIGKQLPRNYCRGMTQIIGKPERILLGVGDGPPGWSGLIALSEDAGDSWRVADMPGPANSTIWNFATNAADPSLVFASSVSGEVYRSTDAGASWTKLPHEFGEIRALAWIPTS